MICLELMIPFAGNKM